MTLSPTVQQVAQQMNRLVEICEAAHQVIMPFWKTGDLEIESKDDDSPVTKADKAANEVIEKALKELAPQIPVVSEEGTQQSLPADALFWLVDPLDGTKSFIRGENEFTVNIALIENRRPVLAALSIPAQDIFYRAVKGQGAFKRAGQGEWQQIHVSTVPAEGNRIVSSRSHKSPKLAAWIEAAGIPVKELVAANSALKFGLVAEGKADLYPRIGPTMEWDTAAGHCLVEAAGGNMIDLNGEPFLYGKEGYLNGGFIVRGKV